jgi:hypothetical protein
MPSTEGVVFCVLEHQAMINRRLITANAPSNMGEQVHVNHEGCPAGEDKKRRLYIKRTDKGLVAYCHHCCEHGFVIENDHSRLSSWVASTKAVKPVAAKKYVPVLGPLSMQGLWWLTKYSCTKGFALDHSFSGIADDNNKVALKLYNHNNEHFGWQVRNLVEEPKYITCLYNDTSDAAWFIRPGNTFKTLVITEDYLSAYRVSMDAPYDVHSVALLKTSLSDKTLLTICNFNFQRIVVWLDPDKAGRDATPKVVSKLKYFLPSSTQVEALYLDKEPKQLTPIELTNIF